MRPFFHARFFLEFRWGQVLPQLDWPCSRRIAPGRVHRRDES